MFWLSVKFTDRQTTNNGQLEKLPLALRSGKLKRLSEVLYGTP